MSIPRSIPFELIGSRTQLIAPFIKAKATGASVPGGSIGPSGYTIPVDPMGDRFELGARAPHRLCYTSGPFDLGTNGSTGRKFGVMSR